ncbi:hypothetical protein BBO99_00001436 [Phytophthora kernoviae]|uniref:Protein odr-4 homolog n=2 Tax=Phytophthora kernoviae TaxID=325452 RepID=A0A3R7IJV5_9STRA|nr:hypothetical protein G195_002146 [Phytophthora kernoviae 00238/432]KAG2530577.1 hypothetical protein JM16_000925 [Phytophthora kernoviae]KAG2531296.1 hypothetical protein JM18_001703 [Phytophthora kernoviae]RLN26126.1 hypothetical protein BBI17_001305 [Phytophthora kernoviae]RLN84367.1 hypothetical protein BBO99_00001436 [Phytophthora kernoviae]
MSRSRQVVVDDQVTEFWNKNADSTFELGLLVGQVSPSNVGDSVLAAVPVPPENERGETPNGLADVSVEWVQEVAQQVDRLLPGGIAVLGLYVISARDVATRAVPYLRATAEAAALLSGTQGTDEVHYLAVVAPNSDVAFQSFYNVMDVNKTQMLSAECKTPTKGVQFKQYQTLIDLDEPTPFVNVSPTATLATTEMAAQRMDEVEKQMQPLFRRVKAAMAVPKTTGDPVVQHMNLMTLTPPEPHKTVEDPLGGVHGAISCVAYVSQSEPEAHEVAANYLKRDFVKSVLVRVELARERWADDDEVEPNDVFKEGGVLRLAQRGLVPWRSAAMLSRHFSATIHVFPDEDVDQAVKNALEIFGSDVSHDTTVWNAMEIGGQLDGPPDFSAIMPESNSKLLFVLVPVFLVLILLFLQYVL